ncbi:MAG: hypothetical protein AAF908_01945 [Pseudomonadota bacterium]
MSEPAPIDRESAADAAFLEAQAKPKPRRKGRAGRRAGLGPPDDPGAREARLAEIRAELIRRRRRAALGMATRFALWVLAPTLLVAWYLWERAVPLYESETVFLVRSAEMPGGAGGGLLGGMLGGRATATQDAIAVQKFILSRDVLERLDGEHGLIAHFNAAELDYLTRLPPEAGFEEAFAFYRRIVSVSFDPSEGVLEMTVRGATPEAAHRFAAAIIAYAEEMVDRLSDPIREAALADSRASMAGAEARLKAAQAQEAEVRNQLRVFSVELELEKENGILSALELELEERRGRLANLRRVTGESDPRIARMAVQVETLEAQIAERKKRMTGGSADDATLADLNAQLQTASFDVQAAMAIFTVTIEAHEAAKADLARQHRYLALVDRPSQPDRAAYPDKWRMTALAFACFLGAYIVLSLTVSLIREQASV